MPQRTSFAIIALIFGLQLDHVCLMFNALYFRTYITLVETGSFTQTARRLDMTQPGVSQHVRKLEHYLGHELLHRQGRHFTLTEAGRRAYDYALKLFSEHEQFRHSLDNDAEHSGECRIASPASVGVMFYPFVLGYQQLHLGLSIHYRFAYSNDIIKDIEAGRYDLGIVTETSRYSELRSELWHHEPLSLVVPADFHGSSLSELRMLGFINYFDGVSHANQLLHENFSGEFRSMNSIPQKGYISEVTQVLDPVARGMGFTVVPTTILESSPWQRQVRELILPRSVYEELYLVTRSDIDLPKRYEQLLNDYREARRMALYSQPENLPPTENEMEGL